jgi:hypothetical protein
MSPWPQELSVPCAAFMLFMLICQVEAGCGKQAAGYG